MTTSFKIWLWLLAAIVGFLIPFGMRFVLNVTDPLFYIIYVFTYLAIGFWLWKKNKEKNLKDRFDLYKQVKKITPEDFGIAKFHEYYQKRKSDDEISQKLTLKLGIKIIGRPGLGKTRASYEAIKKLDGFYLLKPSLATELRFKDIQNIKFPLWVKNVVLFLDDLNKIVGRCDVDHLVNRLKKISGNLIILATCRSGIELDGLNGKKEVEELLNTLQKIEPSLLSQKEEQDLAQNLGIDLSKTKSDRTPGSIVLGLGTMKERYDNMGEEKVILHSLKLLREGRIFIWDEILVKAVVKQLFELDLKEHDWNGCLNSLIENEYLVKNLLPAVKMQHDIYLDDIIVDDYKPNVVDLQKLKEVLIKENYAEFLMDLSTWFYEKEDFDSAAQACEQAIVIRPHYSVAYTNWGVALFNLGKYEKAVEKFQKAVDIDPKNVLAYFNWGILFGKQGRYGEAIEKYQKAVEINPTDGESHINWGNALAKLGRYGESIEKYQRAIEINPKLAAAYYNWANSLRRLEKYGEAAQKYEKAVEANPEYAMAYGNWALNFWDLGNRKEAVEKLEIARQLFANQGKIEDVEKAENVLKEWRAIK